LTFPKKIDFRRKSALKNRALGQSDIAMGKGRGRGIVDPSHESGFGRGRGRGRGSGGGRTDDIREELFEPDPSEQIMNKFKDKKKSNFK
jgi:hypothetical protein